MLVGVCLQAVSKTTDLQPRKLMDEVVFAIYIQGLIKYMHM